MRTEEEIRLKEKEIAEHQSVLYEKFCTAFDEKKSFRGHLYYFK